MFSRKQPEMKGTGKGKMRIMDPRVGDRVLEWDVEQPETLVEVEKEFAKLQKEGFAAYQFPKEGATDGDVVRKFDPRAGDEIVMTPAVAGG